MLALIFVRKPDEWPSALIPYPASPGVMAVEIGRKSVHILVRKDSTLSS